MRICITITKEQKNKLDKISKRTGQSYGSIIRYLIAVTNDSPYKKK